MTSGLTFVIMIFWEIQFLNVRTNAIKAENENDKLMVAFSFIHKLTEKYLNYLISYL